MNIFLLQKTKIFLLRKFNLIPQIAIITGSGIKLFTDYKPLFLEKYSKIPSSLSSPASRVKGHEGKLKLFKIKNKNILVFSGRKHLYEGLDITEVTRNIRLCYELGVQKIIITNAAGGINKKLKIGDLMLIIGYVDLMQPTERGLLNGITQRAAKVKSNLTSRLLALNSQFGLKKGIYAGLLGPTYETFSEIKFLKLLGASAVGMSTIPEMICSNSLKLNYAGISIISNTWNSKHKPSHKEVLQHVSRANKKLNSLFLKLIDHL